MWVKGKRWWTQKKRKYNATTWNKTSGVGWRSSWSNIKVKQRNNDYLFGRLIEAYIKGNELSSRAFLQRYINKCFRSICVIGANMQIFWGFWISFRMFVFILPSLPYRRYRTKSGATTVSLVWFLLLNFLVQFYLFRFYFHLINFI